MLRLGPVHRPHRRDLACLDVACLDVACLDVGCLNVGRRDVSWVGAAWSDWGLVVVGVVFALLKARPDRSCLDRSCLRRRLQPVSATISANFSEGFMKPTGEKARP